VYHLHKRLAPRQAIGVFPTSITLDRQTNPPRKQSRNGASSCRNPAVDQTVGLFLCLRGKNPSLDKLVNAVVLHVPVYKVGWSTLLAKEARKRLTQPFHMALRAAFKTTMYLWSGDHGIRFPLPFMVT
jgi:hypothetical protein